MESAGSSSAGIIAAIIIGVVCFGFIIFMIVRTSRLKRAEKKHEKYMKEKRGAILSTQAVHKAGLPLSDNLYVDIYCTADELIFQYGSQEWTLANDRVVGVETTNGHDSVSKKLTGMVVGGALLGTAGLVFGALSSSSTYMVITYTQGSQTSYLMFEITKQFSFPRKLRQTIDKNRKAIVRTTSREL